MLTVELEHGVKLRRIETYLSAPRQYALDRHFSHSCPDERPRFLGMNGCTGNVFIVRMRAVGNVEQACRKGDIDRGSDSWRRRHRGGDEAVGLVHHGRSPFAGFRRRFAHGQVGCLTSPAKCLDILCDCRDPLGFASRFDDQSMRSAQYRYARTVPDDRLGSFGASWGKVP